MLREGLGSILQGISSGSLGEVMTLTLIALSPPMIATVLGNFDRCQMVSHQLPFCLHNVAC
jgi:hypothetical protein